MFWVGAADNADNAVAFDDSAILADHFHGSFHFHGFLLAKPQGCMQSFIYNDM
jgi:hypothetical protein